LANIVVLGAGIGGVSVAYELKAKLGRKHVIKLISSLTYFQFTPSNPWVGVGWRKRKDITLDLAPLMKRRRIGFESCGAKQISPAENVVELNDGRLVGYD